MESHRVPVAGDTAIEAGETVFGTLSGIDSSAAGARVLDRRRRPRIEQPDARRSFVYGVRSFLTSLPLVAADVVALSLGLALGDSVSAWWATEASSGLLQQLSLLVVGLVAAKVALGLYPAVGLHGAVELKGSTTAVFLLFGAIALGEGFRGGNAVILFPLALAAITTSVAIPLLRAQVRWLCSRFRWWGHRMIVIGAYEDVTSIVDYFESRPRLGLKPIPLVSDSKRPPPPARISSLAEDHDAVWGALALRNGDWREEEDGVPFVLRYCASLFPSLLVVPEPGVLPSLWTRTTDVGGVVGIQAGTGLLRPAPRFFKRVLDLSLAVVIALLSLPLFVAVAIMVKVTSPGPIFYGHERVGRGRRKFTAWKFRTMHQDASELLQEHLLADLTLRREWEKDHKLRNDPRITSIGRVLRKWSLDELPQLWNIIRGDMSLVGPRPIVDKEIPKYGREFGLYLSVAPGLTGLWQVSGRNKTTYEERVAFDRYYVENWSLWLDLYVLGRTVRAVITGDGAC